MVGFAFATAGVVTVVGVGIVAVVAVVVDHRGVKCAGWRCRSKVRSYWRKNLKS